MGRVTASREKEIGVYLVVRDPLAQRYLQKALARDQSIVLLPDGSLRRNRERCGLPSVIVVAWGPASSGTGLLRALRRSAPGARILILGPRLAAHSVMSLLQAGAHGFVDIEKVETDLLPAIRSPSEGRAWRGLDEFGAAARPAAAGRSAAERSTEPGKSEPRFTAREAEVIALVRQGLSNKQVASELGITEATVKFHLKNIFVKAGISHRHAIAGVVPAGPVETRARLAGD